MARRRHPRGAGAPILLPVKRFEQPDDVTCGPTCLAQVYRYYGYTRELAQIVGETRKNADGGTLAVYLGLSALARGFRPTIYSYNLRVFDPTWRTLGPAELCRRLQAREQAMRSRKLRRAIQGYLEFIRAGGKVRFNELRRGLLVRLLRAGHPILTGLSATYLYRTPREHREAYDDVRGQPAGHFLVVCGYYPRSDRFVVRDPATHIPFSATGRYSVTSERLIAAILLGDVTYDAVLLVLGRRRRGSAP